jgi:hypothetical protein
MAKLGNVLKGATTIVTWIVAVVILVVGISLIVVGTVLSGIHVAFA